jgi:uroporphyrin-3 C-methyltransferase
MTEQTPANDTATIAAPGAATSSAAGSANPPPGAKPPRARSGASALVSALVIFIVLAVVLGGALWLQRKQFLAAAREVATRLDSMNATLAQTRAEAREAQALAQAQARRLTVMEQSLRENQGQYAALQQAWQDFNDNTGDEVVENDVERLLTIANQQLRLAGNVGNAIVALETAQSRLARANRPNFASLQQTINGDLDRLRAVPTVDIPALSGRIDRLTAVLDRAPLLVPDAAAPGVVRGGPAPRLPPTPVERPPLPPDAPWWQRWRAEIASWPTRAGNVMVRELGELVQVQRVDEPGALLLSPQQADQLRATLRQRLLTVQLALLMRQPVIWKKELDSVSQVVDTYYDKRSPETLAAMNLLRELTQAQIAVPVPDVNDSLAAVTSLRNSATSNGPERN